MGQGKTPSSGTLYFFAVLFWIIAWWLIDLGINDPVTRAVGVFMAAIGLGHAMGAVNLAVPTPSPFASSVGRILWVVRPRAWVIAWLGLMLSIFVFGKPMVLWKYGAHRCEYVDWNFDVHIRLPQRDGAFAGCRFLSSR